jgi:acyl carrier protein
MVDVNDASIIKDFISTRARVPASELSLDDDLSTDLGMDSLDLIEVIMAIEDHFDIEIPDEDSEKWSTVQDILDYMDIKL